ncbi:MAG TPA: hypothetical protein VMO26_18175 [Vicinamibacterales bacterium]|nr:hypothetical protein [Vicinamibacterales bacterium]
MVTALNASGIELAVFLSRATSIADWDERGIVDRETALYRRLRRHLVSLRIVTSGGH